MIRGTTIVSLITLLSRVLGFVRDLLMANLFGAGFIADAFVVAFRIPNLLRSFVAEGALTSAFVPVFTSELHEGKERGRETVRSVSGFLFLVTVLLSLLGIVFSEEIVSLFAPGFGVGTAKAKLCIKLTQIMFPYIICVSYVAMLNGALNSIKIFGRAALAQVVMNCVLIAGAIVAGWCEPITGVYILALSVLVGGVVQVIIQIPTLKKEGFSILPSQKIFSPQVSRLVKLMFPAVIGATVYQLSIFLSTVLASLLEPGSVSYLFYADRLTQLPIGIFSIALASVLLPTLASAQARADEVAFGENLIDALRYTSFIMLPVSALLFVFAKPLIVVMFERGAFDANSSEKTAQAVQAFSVGLWGISCLSMVSRAFIAKHDTKTPTFVGIVTLMISLLAALLFMGPPHSETKGIMYDFVFFFQDLISPQFLFSFGHQGLALSTSISSLCGFILLAMLLKRHVVNLFWKRFIHTTFRSTGATVGMVCCVLAFPGHRFGPYFTLLIGGGVGVFSYIFFSRLFRSIEYRETREMFIRKLKRA